MSEILDGLIFAICFGQSPPTITTGTNNITKGLGFLGKGDWAGFAAAWKARDVKSEIDSAATIVDAFLKIGAEFVPQLAIPETALEVAMVLVPLIDKLGGTTVPDGRGGTVPVSNSHYDPKSGRFLKGPFHESPSPISQHRSQRIFRHE